MRSASRAPRVRPSSRAEETGAELGSTVRERGYFGPVRVLSAAECGELLGRLHRERPQPPLDWGKGWAATSIDFYEVAADERILDLVTGVLGRDVLLWGVSLVERKPGVGHPWHTDIESSSPVGETLSVWIGLANTNARSSLKVVPFSHRFGVTLQQVVQEEGGGERLRVGDTEVTAWARVRNEDSGVVPVPSVDGEAVVFDGRLWHASENTLQEGVRSAVLLQYATPSTPIRIPNLERLTWPFELFRAPKPACIVVSGHDVHHANRTVPGPRGKKGSLPALSTWIHSLHLPLEQDPEVGWKMHRVFRGSTPVVKELSCHASVLDPGHQPHLPQSHPEEEILAVLDGEAELVLEAADGTLSRSHAERGAFVYYPRDLRHTIRNTSAGPVSYLVLKWSNDRDERGETIGRRLVSLSDVDVPPEAENGFSAVALLDGQTRHLRHLHAHVTTLQPGGGYAPHVDAHDVCIVVLDGTIETLGERVGRNSVVYCCAGETHGMRNAGDIPAVYLVFELHGRYSNRERAPAEAASKRVRSVARNPRLWKRAIVHVARRLGRRH